MRKNAVLLEKTLDHPDENEGLNCLLLQKNLGQGNTPVQSFSSDAPVSPLSTCFVVMKTASNTNSVIAIMTEQNSVGWLSDKIRFHQQKQQRLLVLLPPKISAEIHQELHQITAQETLTSGVLLVAADGLDLSKAQNDSRTLGKLIPVFEPLEPNKACEMALSAFETSEEFSVPVLLRLTPAMCQRSVKPKLYQWLASVEITEEHNQQSLISARKIALANYVDESDWALYERGKNKEVGFIVAGSEYRWLKTAYPDAPILCLGISFPLPLKKIRGLIAGCKKTIVIETGLPLIEEQLRSEGFHVFGRSALQ